jgi:hypothetical protein
MADVTTSQQIVREAPEVEAYKLDLLKNARALAYGVDPNTGQALPANQTLAGQLPAYQVAGFSPAQQAALNAAQKTGIGSFGNYLDSANAALNAGYQTTAEAADVLRGADTRGQYYNAQQDINSGINALSGMQNLAAQSSQADLQPATAAISQGLGGLGEAQGLTLASRAADLQPSTSLLGIAAQQTANVGTPDYAQARNLVNQGISQGNTGLQQGIGKLSGSTGAYNPASAQAFMDPYKQQVLDRTMAEMTRQGKIAQQGSFADAVRAGAVGGSRDAIQRAEMERNLMEQKANVTANLLSQGYTQAQTQAQNAFEQQQQRGIQAGTGIGSLSAQQGQLGLQGGQAIGNMDTTGSQIALQGAGQLANIGQTYGQQAVQQAQLGQGAAAQYGNLANQQIGAGQGLGQLGVQQAQLGQGAAGLYGQAAGMYGNLAGQEGTLAAQQFGIGQQMASGLGSLGAQAGQFGINQAALGQTAQGMNQNDINFLYNTGQASQALNQQGLDAQRATQLQQAYAPYQQAGFLSDIYRGAPSTQMSTAVASQPTASPFQQAVGIGLGAASTYAGAKKAFGP